jgi:hypothetical protein
MGCLLIKSFTGRLPFRISGKWWPEGRGREDRK